MYANCAIIIVLQCLPWILINMTMTQKSIGVCGQAISQREEGRTNKYTQNSVQCTSIQTEQYNYLRIHWTWQRCSSERIYEYVTSLDMCHLRQCIYARPRNSSLKEHVGEFTLNDFVWVALLTHQQRAGWHNSQAKYFSTWDLINYADLTCVLYCQFV